MASLRKKLIKAYLLVLLGLILLPFVTQKEFYPFLSFVMFANESLEKETFEVICRGQPFELKTIGLDKGQFDALCKIYFHQNQCEWFLENLKAGPCKMIRVFKSDTSVCQCCGH